MFPITGAPRITGLFTLFRRECKPDFVFKGESHDFWELVCVIDGCVRVAADEQVFELRGGQAILHPPMQFHNISSAGNTAPTYIICSFNGENIPSISDRVCRIPDISAVKTLLELGTRCFTFYSDIHIGGFANNTTEPQQFIRQLELLLLSLADQPSQTQQAMSQSARNYSRIVTLLNEQVPQRLTVPAIATLCRMSEVNLQKTFSRYAGVGVMEYYTRLCMRHANGLLQQGYSVKEVAAQLGYSDQNYFSTVFKRITGHTPSRVGRGAE